VLLALVPLSVPALAVAQQEPRYDIEITPFVGYGFNGDFESDETDASVHVDDGGSFGLILNGRDTRVTQWEVFYARQSTSADTSAVPGLGADTDVDFDIFQLGGTYLFDGDSIHPFISAGIGGTYVSPDSAGLENDTFWSFSIGTGLQFFTDRRWGVRLEARGIGTIVDSESSLFCVSSGGAACAFHLEGTVLWQMQTFAGFTFRF
jgi:hypothetical protein